MQPTSPLTKAVASGDLRKSLEALRDLLAARLEGAEARESAALARQLHEVLLRIAALPVKEKSKLDELAKRRTRRQAKVPQRAAGGVKRGPGGG